MKDYDPGNWGLTFIFSLEGSVFPRAFSIAFPNACIAVGMYYFWRNSFANGLLKEGSAVDIGQIWSLFNFTLTFAVSFRAQRAYSRWWEGGTLLQQARGEWFNGYSSLIAFCTKESDKYESVKKFQHSLSRLVSMLHACALMSVSTDAGIDFEVIDAAGISETHLDFLRGQSDKCEIIMQWIQRLIVDHMENGILPIPAPVISRVFQELSRGIVNIHNVRKITEFQFPFPLAQMIMLMLICQWFASPVVCSLLLESPIWAAFLSFVPTFAAWGINFIASEIEQPFGTDANDMPMHFMQASMNKSVLSLLEELAQEPPSFDLDKASVQEIKPSKNGPADDVTDTRSIVFLTVRDQEQLGRLSRRFASARPMSKRALTYDTTVKRLSRQGSSVVCRDNPALYQRSSSSFASMGTSSRGLGGLAKVHVLHTIGQESEPKASIVLHASRSGDENEAARSDDSRKSPAWESKLSAGIGHESSDCSSTSRLMPAIVKRSIEEVTGLEESGAHESAELS